MTSKELIIHVTEENINIAMLEGGQLVELHKEERASGFCVGDIYLGKVRKTMSGLNAAFVNIGHPKDAFIHYLDLGNNYKSMSKLLDVAHKKKQQSITFSKFPKQEELKRSGRINDILSSGQNVLVQVIKESISTKGPRISSDISLTGRHVVLLPFGSKVSISQKIKNNTERRRLKVTVGENLPLNFGAIIRTAALNQPEEDIINDIKSLVKRWDDIIEKCKTAQVPSLIMSEEARVNTMLRDLLNSSFTNIYVDDETICEEIREYIRLIAPDRTKIVKYYKGTAVSIFDNFDITRQIKGLFGKLVPFKRKAYMIIEHTEAMHVIDINSGPRIKNAESQEEIALEVNLGAVPLIARQLKLRDMGGIIVIDFIDMHKNEHKERLFQAMREAMSTDRAKHTILPLSKFGLMQITRQRVRSERQIDNKEMCPTCKGTGKISPAILFDTEIENQIASHIEDNQLKFIKIAVHPYVKSYLTSGLISKRMRWVMKYKCAIKIVEDESLGVVEARYYDKTG
ncbi:MAG: Rne/Rng family ribonuclease, partial [Rikenellaceae bacterium]